MSIFYAFRLVIVGILGKLIDFLSLDLLENKFWFFLLSVTLAFFSLTVLAGCLGGTYR